MKYAVNDNECYSGAPEFASEMVHRLGSAPRVDESGSVEKQLN